MQAAWEQTQAALAEENMRKAWQGTADHLRALSAPPPTTGYTPAAVAQRAHEAADRRDVAKAEKTRKHEATKAAPNKKQKTKGKLRGT